MRSVIDFYRDTFNTRQRQFAERDPFLSGRVQRAVIDRGLFLCLLYRDIYFIAQFVAAYKDAFVALIGGIAAQLFSQHEAEILMRRSRLFGRKAPRETTVSLRDRDASSSSCVRMSRVTP